MIRRLWWLAVVLAAAACAPVQEPVPVWRLAYHHYDEARTDEYIATCVDESRGDRDFFRLCMYRHGFEEVPWSK